VYVWGGGRACVWALGLLHLHVRVVGASQGGWRVCSRLLRVCGALSYQPTPPPLAPAVHLPAADLPSLGMVGSSQTLGWIWGMQLYLGGVEEKSVGVPE
jgi:hypothetical protein